MSTIKEVRGREILDSRGNPTVEAEVTLSDGSIGVGRAPSGASTGTHEAVELRDDDPKRFLGKGVLKAVEHVKTEISKALQGRPAEDQSLIDHKLIELDGTPNKARLGANSILAVSLAVGDAAAKSAHLDRFEYLHQLVGKRKMLMPVPMMNIVNGGKHADNPLDIQEFMIIPHGFDSFPEALRSAVEIFHHLHEVLKKADQPTSVGDEGGFSPKVQSVHQVFDYVLTAIEQAGYQPGKEVSVGLDVAASELYDRERHSYRMEGRELSADKLHDLYAGLIKEYPTISLEDPFHEDDWVNWQRLSIEHGGKLQIVGDDLFVTNPERLKIGFENQAANAVLIKLNQIGTLTETLETIDLALDNDYRAIISHRSGETEDTFIADLVVATGVGQIKTGAPDRSERTAKYNQLLRIHELLGDRADFAQPFK